MKTPLGPNKEWSTTDFFEKYLQYDLVAPLTTGEGGDIKTQTTGGMPNKILHRTKGCENKPYR